MYDLSSSHPSLHLVLDAVVVEMDHPSRPYQASQTK
jgi:hypothetical protein